MEIKFWETLHDFKRKEIEIKITGFFFKKERERGINHGNNRFKTESGVGEKRANEVELIIFTNWESIFWHFCKSKRQTEQQQRKADQQLEIASSEF